MTYEDFSRVFRGAGGGTLKIEIYEEVNELTWEGKLVA